MTFEQYWYGEAWLSRAYREMDELGREKRNQEMWWQGAYIYKATSTAIYNNFSGKKPIDYPQKPYRITPETEEEKKAKVKAERAKIANYFSNLKKNWDKKNGK